MKNSLEQNYFYLFFWKNFNWSENFWVGGNLGFIFYIAQRKVLISWIFLENIFEHFWSTCDFKGFKMLLWTILIVSIQYGLDFLHKLWFGEYRIWEKFPIQSYQLVLHFQFHFLKKKFKKKKIKAQYVYHSCNIIHCWWKSFLKS